MGVFYRVGEGNYQDHDGAMLRFDAAHDPGCETLLVTWREGTPEVSAPQPDTEPEPAGELPQVARDDGGSDG